MEALPRLPLLSFDIRPYFLKNAQFGPDLMNLIKQCYGEDPNNYLEEIQKLEKLRQQAIKVNRDIDGCNLLKKYFCQLYFLQKRFPMLKDCGNISEISWKDVLTSANSKKIDYRSEFTVTLYNIGALHTQLGASDDRTTPEGLKLAFTHFQCAAWAFQYLQEITAVNVRSDFDPGFLQFLVPVCLAQAQECIAEKSITDNRRPHISAKVVAQICDYYGTAMNALTLLKQEDSIIVDCSMKNSHVWLNYIRFKKPYYECIMNLFMGMVAEAEEKMGERVAYFELAADKLDNAIHNFKHIDILPLNKGLDEALSLTRDIVEGKRKNALSENDFIYHEAVPPKDSLPKVSGAVLVKCIGFDLNDPEISGPDIFSRLISMKVHKLSSVYSEEKAQLLRKVSVAVEDKDTELTRIMQSFKLDYLNLSEDPNKLPEELIEKCAAFQAAPNLVEQLDCKMEELQGTHNNIKKMMSEIMQLIEHEEKAEEEFQIIMNSTSRSQSIVTTDLKCQANRYMEAIEKTAKSNESLINAVSNNADNFELLRLTPHQLESKLPRVLFDYSPDEELVVRELQLLVDKVEEMKSQRTLLLLQLRDSLRDDDITDQIVLSDEDKNAFNAIVQKSISKHQKVVDLIEQNLKAQENILNALTSAYSSYAPIRKIISDVSQKRDQQINSLIRSFYVYNQLQEKTGDGLKFYSKLKDNVSKLLARVTSGCSVQQEEREQIYENTGKRQLRQSLSITESISNASTEVTSTKTQPTVLKLKDYLDHKRVMGNVHNMYPSSQMSLSGIHAEMCNVYTIPTTTAVDSLPYHALNGQPTFGTNASVPGTGATVASTNSIADTKDLRNTHAAATGDVVYPFPQPYSYAYQVVTTNSGPVGPSNASATIPQNVASYYGLYGQIPNVYPHRVDPATSNGSYTPAQQMTYSNFAYNPYYTSRPANLPPTQIDGIQADYGALPSNVANLCPVQGQRQLSNSYCIHLDGNRGQNYASPPSPYRNTADGGLNVNTCHSIATNSVMSSTYTRFTTTPTPLVPANQTYSISNSSINNAVSIMASLSQEPSSSYVSPSASSLSTPTNYYNHSNYQSNRTHNYAMLNYASAIQLQQKTLLPPQQQSTYLQQTNVHANYPTTQSVNTIPSNTPVNYASIDCMSPNSTNYINASHLNTQNIESISKSQDGRTYATQYAINSHGSGYNISGGSVSRSGSISKSNGVSEQYYSMQYGDHHQHESSEQKIERRPDEQSTVTYTQAMINKNDVIQSASPSCRPTTSESKPESNIDLLADLDFSLSDEPLLPVIEVHSPSTKIIDQLRSLDLNLNGNNTEKDDQKQNMNNKTKDVERNAKLPLSQNAFESKEYLDRLVQEMKKLEKFVDRLTVKTLNGSLLLDTLWADHIALQERFSNNKSTIEARKYEHKNRRMDCVPYDDARVILLGLEPNYINASFITVRNVSAPDFIVTQAPTSSTTGDFWLMVWQQEVELLICLLTENEIPYDEVYWPKEKNKVFEPNGSIITLLSVNIRPHCIERILSITRDNTTRIVTHIQISSWLQESFVHPSNNISELVKECISLYYEQRDLHHKIILISKEDAFSRNAILATLLFFACEIVSGNGISDLLAILRLLSDGYTNFLKDKQYLLSIFQLALCHVQNIIQNHVRPSSNQLLNENIKAENSCSTNAVNTESQCKITNSILGNEEDKQRKNRPMFTSNLETNDITNLATAVSTVASNDPLSSIDPLWSLKKELN